MRYAKTIITAVLLLSLIQCCKEEDPVFPAPDIRFEIAEGYASNDTTLLLSDTVYIKIIASTNSDMELTHFNIKQTADSVETSVDTGMFEKEFTYEKMIVKGIAYNEKWEFYVRDRYGKRSEMISISFTKDSASIFGNIRHIPSVILGAQNNTTDGFFGLFTEQTYSSTEANSNQGDVDLLYYYDLIDTDENTISSPGGNIDPSLVQGSTDLTAWTNRMTTRFVYQDGVTEEEFMSCDHDSLILENTFVFLSGKRKAKNLQAGHIYSFITNDDGKKGMFRVLNVDGQENGTIEIEIKIQE